MWIAIRLLRNIAVLSLVVIACIPVNSSVVYAEDDPLTCSLEDFDLVVCTVRIDKAVITDVVLNRGNCKSPIPTDAQRDAYKNLKEGLSNEEKSILEFGISYFANYLTLKGKKSLADAIVLSHSDPVGEYIFGDRFKFLNTCDDPDNLIEFTITINDEDWVWEIE